MIPAPLPSAPLVCGQASREAPSNTPSPPSVWPVDSSNNQRSVARVVPAPHQQGNKGRRRTLRPSVLQSIYSVVPCLYLASLPLPAPLRPSRGLETPCPHPNTTSNHSLTSPCAYPANMNKATGNMASSSPRNEHATPQRNPKLPMVEHPSATEAPEPVSCLIVQLDRPFQLRLQLQYRSRTRSAEAVPPWSMSQCGVCHMLVCRVNHKEAMGPPMYLTIASGSTFGESLIQHLGIKRTDCLG